MALFFIWGTIGAAVLTAVLAVMAIFNEEKRSRARIGMTIASGILTVGLAVATSAIPAPVLTINAERTGITAEASKGLKVEYRIGSANGKWHTYRQPIKGIKQNATVYARAKHLLWTSDTSSLAVVVNEYDGRLYLPYDAQGVALKSIDATYNDREPKKNKAGNHYIGYVLKPEDFSVHGTVTGKNADGNDQVAIDSAKCTFSPEKLTREDNDITVFYRTSYGKTKKCMVSVPAREPELLSISAKLKTDTPQVIGTSLHSENFDVVGTFENGKKHLNPREFSISPDEIIEGKNAITVRSGKCTDIVKFTGSEETSQGEEEEPNNEFENATLVALNSQCSGRLSTADDIDFYKINIRDEKGCLVLHFGHKKFDAEYRYWEIAFFSSDTDGRPMIQMDSTGMEQEKASSKIRLTKGVYYIRVTPGSYRDDEYWLRPEYQKAPSLSETEPNDDFSAANEIKLNTSYEGNFTQYSNRQDEDYYKFTLPQKGKVSISLTHERTDDNWDLWLAELYGDSQTPLLTLRSKGSETTSTSYATRLNKGDYYLKLSPNYQETSGDYHLIVNYTPEGNETETEPNDTIGNANPISSSIRGNLGNENDVDVYSVNVSTGTLTIHFQHSEDANAQNSADSWPLWQYSLLNSNGQCLPDISQTSNITIRGDTEGPTNSWTGLANGNYYIKVSKASYFSNTDYTLSIGA